MADSKSEAVGDAVQAAVEDLGLTRPGSGEAVPVARRKRPDVPEGDTLGLAQVVVSVGDPGPTEHLTSREKMRTYPVAVTIVTAGGRVAGDDMAVRAWRDRIDAAVDTRAAFAGLAGFCGVTAGGGAPFDQTALSKDFNYSIQTFRVSVSEART